MNTDKITKLNLCGTGGLHVSKYFGFKLMLSFVFLAFCGAAIAYIWQTRMGFYIIVFSWVGALVGVLIHFYFVWREFRRSIR